MYTEKDLFNYHTLTVKDIMNAPRISDDYYSESRPGDGFAPSNSIVFKGAAGAVPLRAYLEKLGYSGEKHNAK